MASQTEIDRFASRRQSMVQVQLRDRGITDDRVLEAMRRVPRHEFVEARYEEEAYGDHPVPIGENQTVSQPYMIAVMLQVLAARAGDRVLEVGTGSGYEAALLAELAAEVYTVERHAALYERARGTLSRLGYTNVTCVLGDGSQGLPALAPFDDIIVAAAAPRVPPALLDQLAESGRLAVPVGPPELQELQLITKRDGQPVVSIIETCRFVPLIGAGGFPSGS